MNKDLLNARILIVDDQQVNIELIKNVLEMEGFTQIMEVIDSREALQVINEFNPHLILLDLTMPHISGLDILKSLKKQNLLKETMPVMVLTADTTYETKRNALIAGAKDFLTKPLDLLEVSIRIKNLLSAVYLLLQQQQQNDILEEKVAERTKELKEANAASYAAKIEAEKHATQYRALFNANKDAILLFNILPNGEAGKFIHVNEGALQIFGCSDKTFSNISVYSLGIEDVNTTYIPHISALGLNDSVDLDLMFTSADGAKIVLETKSIKINLDNNTAVMLIARDITERKKHIETIEAQNTSLRKVAFTQSHVVRAPLSRIMALVELLKDDGFEETPEFTKKDMLNGIITSAHELDEIIKDITRITAETLTFEERKKV